MKLLWTVVTKFAFTNRGLLSPITLNSLEGISLQGHDSHPCQVSINVMTQLLFLRLLHFECLRCDCGLKILQDLLLQLAPQVARLSDF